MTRLNPINNTRRTAIAPMASKLAAILFVTTCIAITMSCALINLKKDIKDIRQSTAIVGRVNCESTEQGPIIVAACSMDNDKKIVSYTVLHQSGEYEMPLTHGNYYIFAYRDKNSNLIYEADEPAGQYGNLTLPRTSAVGVVFDIDIIIPEGVQNIEMPHGQIISSEKPQTLYSRQAGVIADLDDERFSEEYGIMGFWEPSSFYKQFGATIYFIEEYDPGKIPVLFIHGATGTPKGWQHFVNHLDRTRYQPWFFYYPTGMRIDSMAYQLLWKLTNLQAKYQFNTIYFTAHSMGGLVARSFIVNHNLQFPYVKLFVSLATPWGGDRLAEYGVKQSPAVIPSWIDMQPEGDFIKSLYRKKMPESVSFYLFYGYRGSRNPIRSNNDGTITLSSLLDHRPQTEAKMSYAFDEDHTSILFSDKVVTQYNATLQAFSKKDGVSPQEFGGYLKINFSFDYDCEGVKPDRAFILRRAGSKYTEAFTLLNDSENGKILGPFPAGEYTACMVSVDAKTKEKYIPVSIEIDTTKELNFVFAPDGVIRGCVATAYEPEDKFIGSPNDRYRSSDTKVRIQSISLKGDGIHRVLTPTTGPEIDNYDYLISRNDGCHNNCYAFFGLPGGDYKLFIKAEGYKPIEKTYSVRPGISQDFGITELIKEIKK